MGKQTTPFQRLIKNIYSQLAKDGAEVTESEFIPEKYANSNREVDILIKKKVLGKEIKIAIECREWGDKNDIMWIDQIIGKYLDLEVDEKIAVSKSGFTGPAIQKAKAHNIKTLKLEEAEVIDWGEKIWNLVVATVKRTDFPEKIYVQTEPKIKNSISLKTKLYSSKYLGTLEKICKSVYMDNLSVINEEVKKILINSGKQVGKANTVKISIPFKPLQEIYFLDNEAKIKILAMTLEIKSFFSESRESKTNNYFLDGDMIREAQVRISNKETYQIVVVQEPSSMPVARTYLVEDALKIKNVKSKKRK